MGNAESSDTESNGQQEHQVGRQRHRNYRGGHNHRYRTHSNNFRRSQEQVRRGVEFALQRERMHRGSTGYNPRLLEDLLMQFNSAIGTRSQQPSQTTEEREQYRRKCEDLERQVRELQHEKQREKEENEKVKVLLDLLAKMKKMKTEESWSSGRPEGEFKQKPQKSGRSGYENYDDALPWSDKKANKESGAVGYDHLQSFERGRGGYGKFQGRGNFNPRGGFRGQRGGRGFGNRQWNKSGESLDDLEGAVGFSKLNLSEGASGLQRQPRINVTVSLNENQVDHPSASRAYPANVPYRGRGNFRGRGGHQGGGDQHAAVGQHARGYKTQFKKKRVSKGTGKQEESEDDEDKDIDESETKLKLNLLGQKDASKKKSEKKPEKKPENKEAEMKMTGAEVQNFVQAICSIDLKKKVQGIVLVGVGENYKEISSVPTTVDEIINFKKTTRKARYIKGSVDDDSKKDNTLFLTTEELDPVLRAIWSVDVRKKMDGIVLIAVGKDGDTKTLAPKSVDQLLGFKRNQKNVKVLQVSAPDTNKQ